MILGQLQSPESRIVTVTRAEAQDFVRSVTQVTQYIVEHAMTSRVFCQGKSPVTLANVASSEANRLTKLLSAQGQPLQISTDALNAVHLLTECALSITHHLDLTNKIAIVGGSITTAGLVWKQPVLSWIGVGIVAISQTIGPLLKIPLLE